MLRELFRTRTALKDWQVRLLTGALSDSDEYLDLLGRSRFSLPEFSYTHRTAEDLIEYVLKEGIYYFVSWVEEDVDADPREVFEWIFPLDQQTRTLSYLSGSHISTFQNEQAITIEDPSAETVHLISNITEKRNQVDVNKDYFVRELLGKFDTVALNEGYKSAYLAKIVRTLCGKASLKYKIQLSFSSCDIIVSLDN